MADTLPTVKNFRKQSARRLIAVIAILVAANIAAWFFHAQADLTGDKRYTITDATRNMLKHLDRKIEVLVFLDGDDMPAAFQQLSNSTREMLRHFRDISDNKVTFRVIDPLGSDSTAINVLKQYRMQGIPVNISSGKKGMTQKMIFPWALATTPGDSGRIIGYPVFLQEVNSMIFNKKILLKSEMLLEYNLANGVHQLTRKERPAVAYLMGNGEQFDPHIGTALATLQQFYQVDTFNLGGEAAIPTRYKTILINRPTIPFNDQDKFKIDQYVMNGGKIVWLIDPLVASLDSIDKYGTIMTADYDLGLSDMLFEYGARVNPDLIQDAECNKIPLGKPIKMYPWVYDPIIIAKSRHPIVKNLNPILMRFASSIDTVGKKSINKRVLLTSSLYSRVVNNPVELSFNIINHPPDPRLFVKSERPVAVLLSGEFQSLFRHRRKSGFDLGLKFKEQSPQNSMIVISDGDLIRNTVLSTGEMGPLGYDRFNRRFFDNKKFFVNCIDYMLDESGLIEVRTKEFEIRPLDMKKVKKEKQFWTTLNMAAPVVAIILFGLINGFIRRRRYVK